MKTELVYIAGTGVTAEKTQENLKLASLAKKYECNVRLVDGVATFENMNAVREYSPSIFGKIGRMANRLFNIPTEEQNQEPSWWDTITKTLTFIRGYSLNTHIIQSRALEDALHFGNSNTTENTDKTNSEGEAIAPDTTEKSEVEKLVLVGHSRGAAVGVTGTIAQWYAQAISSLNVPVEKRDKIFPDSLKEINLIVMEPVSGPDFNEKLGVDSENISIAEMLSTIQAITNVTFKVDVITSRFEVRESSYPLAQSWSDFTQTPPEGIEVKTHYAGFSHGDLISEELSREQGIYKGSIKPTDLTRAVIQHRIGQITDEELEDIEQRLEDIELEKIENLKQYETGKSVETDETLEQFKHTTSREAHKGSPLSYFLSGESLTERLAKENEFTRLAGESLAKPSKNRAQRELRGHRSTLSHTKKRGSNTPKIG